MSNRETLRSLVLISAISFAACAYADHTPWMGRLRLLGISPSATSSTITGIGGNVTYISRQYAPEIDLNYNFTPNLAADLSITRAGFRTRTTGTTTMGSIHNGRVSAFMPTLTFSYHFGPTAIVDPYMGIGVNWTSFSDVVNGPVSTGGTYSNSKGGSVNVGLDYNWNEHWVANADLKKTYISTTYNATVSGVPSSTEVKFNPWVFGLGVGYRF